MEAILILAVAASLWLSHLVAVGFPLLPGNIDLRHGLRFWNKSVLVNWPTAALLFIAELFLSRRFYNFYAKRQLQQRMKNAQRQAGRLQGADSKYYRPIL